MAETPPTITFIIINGFTAIKHGKKRTINANLRLCGLLNILTVIFIRLSRIGTIFMMSKWRESRLAFEA